MLEVNIRAIPNYLHNRLNHFIQRCQGLDPELIEKSKKLFTLIADYETELREEKPLPPHRVADLGNGLGDAIHYIHSKESQEQSEIALRHILPKAGEKPEPNEIYNDGVLIASSVMGTYECYLVDRFGSSAIDEKGLELISQLTDIYAKQVEEHGKYWTPREIDNDPNIDPSVLLFFVRIVLRKREEVGFKLAFPNPYPTTTPELKRNHNRWNDFVDRFGSPPELNSFNLFEPSKPLIFSPEYLEWEKKVLPETFKQLREELDKDIEARKKDPQIPLANITYSCFCEKKFLQSWIKKTKTIATIVLGSFGAYWLYSQGYTPHYAMAKL